MVFNSFQFLWFFLVFYGLYRALGHKGQNRLLLVASYVFYGAWDPRFLLLLGSSTLMDYYCALRIGRADDEAERKRFLYLSICGNLIILGYFKYFNFFVESAADLAALLQVPFHAPLMRVVLPVGISFYTFQEMNYTIDVYRREIKPCASLPDFALFVSFFPHLVAGPILRATSLLPQILAPRKVDRDKINEGGFLIFWGLFEKVVVADNLAKIADSVFSAPAPYNGVAVLLGVYAFAFQIYCDFAGYSHMARGLGLLMGFDIMNNFNLPYFSVNPRDFWQRWHISLSTWLKDYLYVPLGGNRAGPLMTYRNLALTMLIGGLWHGAAWTFVAWGAYHGSLLIAHRLLEPALARLSPSSGRGTQIWFAARALIFFHLVCVGWLFFRAQSMHQVYGMLRALVFDLRLVQGTDVLRYAFRFASVTWLLLALQAFEFRRKDPLAVLKLPGWTRAGVYAAMLFQFVLYGAAAGKEFIYFRF